MAQERMVPRSACWSLSTLVVAWQALCVSAAEPFPPSSEQIQERYQRLYLDPVNLKVPSITADESVTYDYDIVYVRGPRFGDEGKTTWTEVSHPHRMDAGAGFVYAFR